MIAVAVVCLPIFYVRSSITRGEGLLLFSYYVAYIAYLVITATAHDALPALSTTMTFFVLPLTALGLIVAIGREWRARRNGLTGVADSAIG